MNLINDPWIPVRFKSGKVERIAPWQLGETDDPPVAFAAPRPDFNGAHAQFLIGLLQTCCPPADHEKWVDLLEEPPSTAQLKQWLQPYVYAFELDGDGPKFMQDFDRLDDEGRPINGLFIDMPAGNTLKENKDLFVKRNESQGICVCCTASALFTLQTNAPSGGQGHRTSLRGGGPLTSLVVLDPLGESAEATLWRDLWLNVLDEVLFAEFLGKPQKNASQLIFPWLGHTRTSEKKSGVVTTPKDVSVLQAYWGMPRRLKVDWASTVSGKCSVCGDSNELVYQYGTKNFGINYEGAWQHPLSPHYLDKDTGAPTPIKPQPGGITYDHWQGLTASSDSRKAAQVVVAYHGDYHRRLEGTQLRLWAFGYDMDNMKARCWYESMYPLLLIEDSAQRQQFDSKVEAMLAASKTVAKALQACVAKAWFKRPGDHKGNKSFIKQSYLDATEATFFALLPRLLATEDEEARQALLQEWHDTICRAALGQFDQMVARMDLAQAEPKRAAKAYDELRRALYGKKLKQILGLSTKKGSKA